MIQLRGERFFEVYNGHPLVNNEGNKEHANTERMWDIINTLMTSASWKDSVFFFAYDEGGPFDHVPPVPGKTNLFTDISISTDISSIAVNPDSFNPCRIVSGSFHCEKRSPIGKCGPVEARIAAITSLANRARVAVSREVLADPTSLR